MLLFPYFYFLHFLTLHLFIYFFDVDHFKVYWISYGIVSLFFTFWFFGCEAHGILVPHPGIKPAPPALEGKVLTTGLPRKSHLSLTFKLFFKIFFLSDILCVDCNTWSIFINVIKHSEFISTTLVCGFHFFCLFYISSVCCFCLCTSFLGLPWLSATDWWFKMIGIYSPRVQEAFWKSRAPSAALFPVGGAEGGPPFPMPVSWLPGWPASRGTPWLVGVFPICLHTSLVLFWVSASSRCSCAAAKLCLTLRPRGLQHVDPAALSFSVAWSLLRFVSIARWCRLTTSSSAAPFSFCFSHSQHQGLFQFLGSWFFASGGQSIGASASTAALPENFKGWFPLGLTGLLHGHLLIKTPVLLD